MNSQNQSADQSELKKIPFQRENCQAGVVHVGVGAFHRAHQASYFNDLLAHEGQQNWGVIGINLRPQESPLVEQLAAQDHFYTLKTISAEGDVAYEEIGSIFASYDWSKDKLQAAQVAAEDNIQIISMTVTEGGYYLFDDNTLDLSAEPIKQGLKGEGDCIYTYLRAALTIRKENGGKPVTLLSCDNLLHNGKKLKAGFEQFLSACDDNDLLAWVKQNTTFPSSMVDRITPRMEEEHSIDVQEKFGVNDKLTIMSESFIQWVIEDDFAGEKPALGLVGADIVSNVTPYEDAKIRILNGGHTVVAYLAALKSYETFDQGMGDSEINELLSGYHTNEVLPTVGETPVDLHKYKDVTKSRFSNKNIADAVARICADGASKFPIFILVTLESAYAQGIMPESALKGVASWYVFMRHVAKGKIGFSYVEPKWESLLPLLSEGQEKAFAESAMLWGELPKNHPKFTEQLLEAIHVMNERFPS